MNNKYNLMLQCPQLYIYIAGWVVDAIYSFHLGNRGDTIRSLIAGLISVIFLMYINYCNWGEYQWLTTVHATLVVLVILVKLYALSVYHEIKEEEEL